MIDKVSIITVNYDGKAFLNDFFTSVIATDHYGFDLEIIMVDNGSSDNSLAWTREHFPEVMILESDQNNYARALNLGIGASSGNFVVFSNNDARVHRNWLKSLLAVLKSHPRNGAVQSKILFEDGQKINSVGVTEISSFNFRDLGFEEPDNGQHEYLREACYITGGSVMFRRECLKDVGDWDEDFIMYMEDVDYSLRCRKQGWKLWYAPESILYHHYHGSTSCELCDYICARNRLLFIAKHYPLQIPESISSSAFYVHGQYDLLYRALLQAMRKMCTCQDTAVILRVLETLQPVLTEYLGAVSAHNFFSHLELFLGLRRIKVGIYDHAFHFPGGGQRYVAEMAALMQDRYDVTYISNKDASLENYQKWFGLDLSNCSLKVVKIPFFERKEREAIDEGIVFDEDYNVFDIISEESLSYDIFINTNMLNKVNPLSPVSLFVCHFPDREKAPFFHVDKYDFIITNGDYTEYWLEKRWGLKAAQKIYPPVNMYDDQSCPERKEKIILSVSRFEPSGSKKQTEMVMAFSELCKKNKEIMQGWKLMLVGGTTPGNMYLEKVKELITSIGCPVEIKTNATVAEIKDCYRNAAIFWHACGLEETKPELVEHFGMTTVESMQNYCVPIVIDGGGQREIVEHRVSGFRFSTLNELQTFTLLMVTDNALREKIALQAYARSHLFNTDVFRKNVEQLLEKMELALLGQDVL